MSPMKVIRTLCKKHTGKRFGRYASIFVIPMNVLIVFFFNDAR